MKAAQPNQPLLPLTSLRFFAALLVVFFHCGQAAFAGAPEWAQRFTMNGYQAVSFFFVLSGFVLTYSYFSPDRPDFLRDSRRTFWIARVARIYPVYALALIVALLPFLYRSFVNPKVPLANFIGGVVTVPLLIQSWIPPLALSWNVPAWSLSVEALFYFTFPFWNRRLANVKPLSLVAGSLTVSVVAQLARYYAQPLPESGAPDIASIPLHHFFAYFPLFHLPTFIFGIALGRLCIAHGKTWSKTICSGVFVGSVLIAGVLFSNFGRISPVFLSDAALVPLYGLIIAGATSLIAPLHYCLSRKPVVALGEASYGLYILHSPLWYLACVGMTFIGLGAFRTSVWFFSVFVGVAIFCSLMSFYRLEGPARSQLRSWLARRLEPRLSPPEMIEGMREQAVVK